MHTEMLGSQLETLEPLGETESGTEAVNVGEPAEVVTEIAAVLEEHFGDRLSL